MLASWDFDDEKLVSAEGYEATEAQNLWLVPSWSGQAVVLDSREAAFLRLPILGTSGNRLINPTSGSVAFWFRPAWSSGSEGGKGPGTDARLLEMGLLSADAQSGWLSLYLDPDGSTLCFSGQAKGESAVYLKAPISWKEDEWYGITLNFTGTNSQLFVNGTEVAKGEGVRLFPEEEALAKTGLLIGGDSTGWMLARGAFDELRIFDGPLPRGTIALDYIMGSLGIAIERSRLRIAKLREEGAIRPRTSGEGSGGYSPLSMSGCPSASFNYTNALWLDIMVCPTEATLTLHNTGPDTNYMFFSRENVALGLWNLEADAPGLIETNIVSVTIPLNGRANLFFVGGVGNDSDGDALPDIYEALVTHSDPYDGDTGDTGLPDGFKDFDGDGWTNLDEFRNRQNPSVFNSPPPLAGLFKTTDANNYNVIEWTLPGAPVTSFTIERKTGSVWQSLATVPGDVTSFTDTNLPPSTAAEYRVRADYPSGSSAFVTTESTAPGTTESSYTVPATMARGAGGRMYYVASQDGTDIAAHRIIRRPLQSPHPKNYISEVTTNYPQTYFTGATQVVFGELPASSATNGPFLISTNFLPYHGWYILQFQQVGADGRLGNLVSGDTYFDATPYVDGRQHILENLNTFLRLGDSSQVFNFVFGERPSFTAGMPYGFFSSYTLGGFHWMRHIYTSTFEVLDPYRPFEDNALFRNLCFDPNQFDSTGHFTTGVSFAGLTSLANWVFNFNSIDYARAGSTNIPASLLALTNSQYLFYRTYTGFEDLSIIGLTYDGSIPGWRMDGNARNFFGLPIRSIRVVNVSSSPGPLTVYTVTPGGTMPDFDLGASIFIDAEPPVFNTVGFYFADPNVRDCPGSPTWTSVDQTNQFILGFGKRLTLAAWAKKALLNGYSDKFGYLEHYFDKAYKIASNGTVTTNETGVLSEYGDFFATEPGRVALATKPDLTGGPTANAIVHVIRLQLDVNHDGVMDGRFHGPDNTASGRPFVFWVNNDYDRGNTVDGDDFEEDDLVLTDRDLTQKVPDFAYTYLLQPANLTVPGIPTMRDLEDYARLWTTGITNLLPGLPPNAVIELAWRTSSSLNPTLRLFRAVEADGGTQYLTDENTAQQQLGTFLYVGLVSPTSALQLNTSTSSNLPPTEKYIFCATARGSGELVLRVRVGSTVLAETSAFIQTKDIKEMYERYTAGDSPTANPLPLSRLATDGLPDGITNAFQYPYSPARDTNTPYILFVHGWNLEPWEKDRFAEVAFKRLYWQGYQGRFGSFRWPTDYRFGSKNGGVQDYWDAALFPTHYDRSEFSAWRSALTLRRLLTRLNFRYPSRVHVLSSSMGNVVVGEALRLAGNQVLVNTYVASQAAIPAHVYDGTISAPADLLTFTYNHPSPFIPEINYGPETPNIYSNYLAGNSAAVGRRVNFYNPNDYALAPDKWQWNQILKPDEAPRVYLFDGFPYDGQHSYMPGSPDDDPPWDHFRYLTLGGSELLPIAQNRYEIMAFAAEPRSKALGAVALQPQLMPSVDLGRSAEPRLWPPDSQDAPPNDYTRHKWHSAQFRSTNMRQQGYWRVLLGPEGFNLQ